MQLTQSACIITDYSSDVARLWDLLHGFTIAEMYVRLSIHSHIITCLNDSWLDCGIQNRCNHICCSFFINKYGFVVNIVADMEPDGYYLRSVFRKPTVASALRLHTRFGIACEPPLWNAHGGWKLLQKRTDSKHLFLLMKMWNDTKDDTKKVSEKMKVFRANGPLAPLGAPNPFLNT